MVITKEAQALATRIAEAVLKDELDEGCDISAGMFGVQFSQLIRELSVSSAPQTGKHRYLVSATGYTKTENGGYSPKSFTFDVVTDGPYGSAADVTQSRTLGTMAWGHFHRLFGEYPSQDPQIDSVVLVRERSAEDQESSSIRFPDPHAYMIWIQAGRPPDDFWDDVEVSRSMSDKCCDGSDRYPVYAHWQVVEMLEAAGIAFRDPEVEYENEDDLDDLI